MTATLPSLAHTALTTAGQLRVALKTAKTVYVWCNVWGEDGEYVQVTKAALVRAMSLEPNEGAHGGVPDCREVKARLDGDELYVN